MSGRIVMEQAREDIALRKTTRSHRIKTMVWYKGRKAIRNGFLKSPVKLVGEFPVIGPFLAKAINFGIDKVIANSKVSKRAKYSTAAQADKSTESLRKLAKFEGKHLKDLGEAIDRNMVKLKDASIAATAKMQKIRSSAELTDELMEDAAMALAERERYCTKMMTLIEASKSTLNYINDYLEKSEEECTSEIDQLIQAVDGTYGAKEISAPIPEFLQLNGVNVPRPPPGRPAPLPPGPRPLGPPPLPPGGPRAIGAQPPVRPRPPPLPRKT